MDLSINVEGTTLYIRTAVILKSEDGYILEQSEKGYTFLVGGKLQINEYSAEGVKREIFEEIGFVANNLSLVKVMEHIYTKSNGEKMHEICFTYICNDIYDGVLPSEGFVTISKDDLVASDIRPESIKKILLEDVMA